MVGGGRQQSQGPGREIQALPNSVLDIPGLKVKEKRIKYRIKSSI